MDTETKPVPSSLLLAASAWMWGVPLFAALALATLLATGSNVALFEILNHVMAAGGDAWWSHLTVLGDTSLALVFILPLLGRRPDCIWQFVLAGLFAALWAQGGKELFSSLRPPAVLHAGSFHLIGPMLEHNSFPSGHTTTIFVMAGLFCMQRVDNRLKALVLTLAIFVGLSRIACGVHWPQDVLGGMLGGWLCAVAGVMLARRWQAGLDVRFQRVLAVLLTLSVLWAMFYYDNGIPGTWLFQFIISAVCLAWSVKGQVRLFSTV